jgi:hypothetical protein
VCAVKPSNAAGGFHLKAHEYSYFILTQRCPIHFWNGFRIAAAVNFVFCCITAIAQLQEDGTKRHPRLHEPGLLAALVRPLRSSSCSD